MLNEFAFDRLGWIEWIAILLVIFILFGHWLPRIMRDIGRMIVQ